METPQPQIEQGRKRAFLGNVRTALELLVLDSELIRLGYSYLYVVDFAAIYGYVYKTAELPFLPIPGETPERTFARHQMALQILFTNSPRPLLLIPPYSSELKNHIRTLSSDFELARRDVSTTYKEKLARLIEASEDFKRFVKLRREKPSQAIDDQLRRAAVKVGREYFPELYAARGFISLNGIETLQILFRDQVLSDSEELLPECRDIDYSSESTDRWYNDIYRRRMHNQRDGGTKAYQTWTDAMACTYVELANRRLNSQRKIVVFVSPSGHVERVLDKTKLVSIPSPKDVPVVRDLTYCLLAFIHQSTNGIDQSLLEQNLETVTSLHKIYDSAIPADWRDDAKQVALEWQRCENLLLMRDSSVPEDSYSKRRSSTDSDFLAVLEQLHLAVTEDKHYIASEVEAALSQLHSKTVTIDQGIRSNRIVEAFVSAKIDESSAGSRIMLPGLHGELAILLSFSGKDVAQLARKLRRLKPTRDLSFVMELRDFVLEQAKAPHSTPEHHLLAAYILAAERNYSAALSELDLGRQKDKAATRPELMFLAAAIHRKLYHANEALAILEDALMIAAGDPRLHLEYAKALWLKWREESDSRTAKRHLDGALDHLSIAAGEAQGSSDSETDLRIQIDNVSAFIYTERAVNGFAAGNENLDKAHAHIKNMQKALPETKWVSRFFDTRGYWYYAKAQSLPPDKLDDKKILLDSALTDLDRALAQEEDIGEAQNVRRDHRERVVQALANAAPGPVV